MRRLLTATTCLLLVGSAASGRVAAVLSEPAPIALPSHDVATVHARRVAEAAREFARLVDSNPGNSSAHVGLVRALLKLNKVFDAARAVARACACRPDDPSILVTSGDVAFRQGNFVKAAEAYSRALASEPACAGAHWGLGRVDLVERRNRSAAEHFVAAYRLSPNDPDILLDWASTRPTRRERAAAAERYLALAADEDGDLLAGVRARIEMLRALGERHTFVVVDPRRGHRLPLTEGLTPGGALHAYRLVALVDGQKLRLTIDTGASGILINRDAAERCRLAPLAPRAPVKGVGDEGPRPAMLSIADRVQVGDLEMRDCEIAVDPGHPFEEADGVVGTDIFSHFLVRLDFPRRTIDLLPPDPGERSIADGFWQVERRMRPGFTPIHVLGHLLLADTRINDVPGFLFVVDSGAPTELMSAAAASRVTRLHVSDAVVRGVSGRVRETLTTGRVSLAFADLDTLGAMPAVNLDDQNAQAGTEISGVIGVNALREFEVTIDYTNGLVRLKRGR